MRGYLILIEDDTEGGIDFATVCGVILYFFGFIGMFIMIFNLPVQFIVMGIIAMILYFLPLLMVLIAAIAGKRAKKLCDTDEEDNSPLTTQLINSLYGGGSIVKNIFKKFFAPFAFFTFNILIGLYWIINSLGTTTEVTRIAFIIPCAYAMYYYPFALIRTAIKQKSPLIGILGGLVIIAAFATYLGTYNIFVETGSTIGFAIFQSMFVVLGSLVIILGTIIKNNKKGIGFILLGIYVLLAGVVSLFAFYIIPGQNQDKYDQALSLIEENNYKEAREVLRDVLTYKDANDIYESIKFKGLEVGEKVYMGAQPKKPGNLNYDRVLSWTVIDVKDGKALLLSDAIVTSITYNSASNWNKNCSVRQALQGLEHNFTEEELARILTHSYTIKTKDGVISAKDKIFILSKEELETYCSKENIFIKKDTTYNDHEVLNYGLKDLDHTYEYSYFVRNVDENNKWIIANHESQSFITENNELIGIRPAIYISLDE